MKVEVDVNSFTYVSSTENCIIEHYLTDLDFLFALRGKAKKEAEKILLSRFKSINAKKIYAYIGLRFYKNGEVVILVRDKDGCGYGTVLEKDKKVLENIKLKTLRLIIDAKLKSKEISPSRLFKMVVSELDLPFTSLNDIVDYITTE